MSRNMSEAFGSRRGNYKKATKPDGTLTANNGDLIAEVLLPLEPDETCYIADLLFSHSRGFHLNKYKRLNRGQQRMNAGNRIRGAYNRAVKKDDVGMQRLILTTIYSVIFE